ncbi:MAG TPA: DJ-1/PfpI family protein [Methylibium sp.]|uniref:DJ-1/PfpI family protein n=1 Tax=Methylibium sp. TaxID=2067992 RepID=UPI002DBF730E|nr:DJ-1/PfpI family protein [Methylibium sp.]HEU4460353.1 DJ-1/PfpI family protein [Methylibium sp.]
MHIAILTLDGYNELDSIVALGILNRVKRPGWRVSLACPTAQVTSMNGVVVHAQATLAEACEADAVLLGSGIKTREFARDEALLAQLRLDASRQLIGAQCSGTLLLAKLGLLEGRGADAQRIPACTDLLTKPWVQEAGVEVLDQPFFARGNVATAGGCLASMYLASWLIVRLVEQEAGREAALQAARDAMHYVAPVGEKEAFVERALRNVLPFLPATALAQAASPTFA